MADARKKSPVFDRLMEEYMHSVTAERMLADCMSQKPSVMKRVPLRFRIIALGFAQASSLEEVNGLLRSQGCQPLYARSYLEAGLIYAFKNRLTYAEWKELCQNCEQIRANEVSSDKAHAPEGTYFADNKIRLQELSRYVREYSDAAYTRLKTSQMTRILEQKIISLSGNSQDFRQFFLDNIYIFSEAREKTRYYFCKYLWYYVSAKIEAFAQAASHRPLTEEDYLRLMVIQGVTPLKRHRKMPPEEKREFLYHCDLSCGALFSEFNCFYFNYVSMDWTRVLLEYLQDPEELTEDQREALLADLRRQYEEKASMTDDDLLDWAFENLEDDYDADEDNRLGETAIRKYIKGILDLDRTTLISFLLYFDHCLREISEDYAGNQELAIGEKRLNLILSECGFPILRQDDPFDAFVMRFMKSKDPMECIEDEVTSYAIDGENSYLYHLFWSAGSQSRTLRKLMETR